MISSEHVFAAVSAAALAVGGWSANEVIDHKVKLAITEVRVSAMHSTLEEIRRDVKEMLATQASIQRQIMPVR